MLQFLHLVIVKITSKFSTHHFSFTRSSFCCHVHTWITDAKLKFQNRHLQIEHFVSLREREEKAETRILISFNIPMTRWFSLTLIRETWNRQITEEMQCANSLRHSLSSSARCQEDDDDDNNNNDNFSCHYFSLRRKLFPNHVLSLNNNETHGRDP